MTDKRLPFGLTFEGLLEWTYRLILFFCVIGLIYLRSIFASSENLEKTNDKLATVANTQNLIIPRVEGLEKRQMLSAETNRIRDLSISEIQRDVAAIRATQAETAKNTEKNFDRIFNKLDSLSK